MKAWRWASVLAVFACSGPATPASEGEACFRAEDCQLGLVCVERFCSGDLTPIVPEGAGQADPQADREADSEEALEASDAGD